jgi:hypothetical protein
VPMCTGSTWSTPSASPSRPSAGPPPGRAIPPRPTAGPGWSWPPTPSCAWPAPSPPISGCRGNDPDPTAALALPGAPRGSAAVVRARLASRRTETLRVLLRPSQGPALWVCGPPPGDQQAQEQAAQDREGRLTGQPYPPRPPTSADSQANIPPVRITSSGTTGWRSGHQVLAGTSRTGSARPAPPTLGPSAASLCCASWTISGPRRDTTTRWASYQRSRRCPR